MLKQPPQNSCGSGHPELTHPLDCEGNAERGIVLALSRCQAVCEMLFMYYLISLFQPYFEDFDISNEKKEMGAQRGYICAHIHRIKKWHSWDLNPDLATVSCECPCQTLLGLPHLVFNSNQEILN